MNTNERSLRNASWRAWRTLRKKVLALVTQVETSQRTKISGRRGRRGRYLRSIGTPPVWSAGAHRASDVDVGVALAALQLVALGGEPALELRDDPVDLGEVLDRAARQRAVELAERALGRKALGALDQVALELSSQVLLEAPELVSRDPRPGADRPPGARAAARFAGRARGGSAARRRRARPIPRRGRRRRSRGARGRACAASEPSRSAAAICCRSVSRLISLRRRRCRAGRPSTRRRPAARPRPRRRGRRSGRTRARTRAGPRATWRASRRASP